MAVNIGIPMFIGVNALADRLSLSNKLRGASFHVRFVEDEVTVRMFLSLTGISFPFQSPVPITSYLKPLSKRSLPGLHNDGVICRLVAGHTANYLFSVFNF